MDGSNSQNPAPQRVTLAKGAHRWSFSCEAGDEAHLMGAVQTLATEGAGDFDWLDAAVVSHQLARGLTSGLHTFSNSNSHL